MNLTVARFSIRYVVIFKEIRIRELSEEEESTMN